MATIILSFPGGRYHATPWGHHVNEGLIEWPPSPWRLLRALLAVGYSAGIWDSAGPPDLARSLIEKLAGQLPAYHLPPAAGAHSRHYMPLARLKNGREDTTLVFDTWAQIDDGEMAVCWDVNLTIEESGLLAKLVERLGYLGRSESWVVGRLAGENEVMAKMMNCFPEDGSPRGPGWEQVPLFTAQSPTAYSEWRARTVAEALKNLPVVDPTKKRQKTKADAKIIAQRQDTEKPYPADLIACLQVTTDWLHNCGWSQPPGSRRVFYWRRVDAIEAGAPTPRSLKICARPVETMLLAMATASRNDHALPPVVRTLPQAELLHKQVVGHLNGTHHEALTGRNRSRVRLDGPHQHAHLLPLDLDNDGHLEHILIWAPMGLDNEAQTAVRAVRQTFTKGGVGPLRLALAGGGEIRELRKLPSLYGDGLRQVLGPPAGATDWVSITPFVPPRHVKRNGRNSLEGQIIAELASRQLPAPIDMIRLEPNKEESVRRLRHFVRTRRNGPAPPVDCGFAFALRFAEPVPGPLCLGYASHFGLGMFRAVFDQEE